MKIIITGAGGMLGRDLGKALQPGFRTVGVGRRPADCLDHPYFLLDLTDAAGLQEFFERQQPGLVFHTAAMTDVDGCEREPEKASRDNVQATENVIQASRKARAFLIFFSTDYIFDGTKRGEYKEDDKPQPLNSYGLSKWEAEQRIEKSASHYAIFRLSWLYGRSGRSFPRAILERAASGVKRFEVVADQIGRPTYTRDVAEAFARLLSRGDNRLSKMDRQIFHLGNQGAVSWADFAGFILNSAGFKDAEVEPVARAPGDRPARRPKNSVLSLEKAERVLGMRLRPWQEAVKDFILEFRAPSPRLLPRRGRRAGRG